MLHINLKGTENRSLFSFHTAILVKAWVERIEILFIKLIRSESESLSETLIVYNLSCTKELD